MYGYYQPDGYRQLITIKCPDHMKRDDFNDWIVDHAQREKYVPGLRWYTVCFTFNTIDYSDGSPGLPVKFDVFEEMYFSSLKDLKGAYGSDVMHKELYFMAEKGLMEPDIFNGLWAEANIIKMKGLTSPPKQKNCARIFGGCRRTKEMSKKDLKDWYHSHAERVIDEEGKMIIPEIIGYTHNFSLDDSPFGIPFIDAYCNNWWASIEDMFKTFSGDIWRGQLEHREDHIDAYDKSFFIGALATEHIVDLPNRSSSS
ncbi:MAG: hypothetical protein AMS17_01745 [Spirochaetes bacterium DG_61]|nr:MAG: hypothetical protein AMS17_01745 [Spirochaetes bacterium DG_61]